MGAKCGIIISIFMTGRKEEKMFKKIISLLCCVVPVAAVADIVDVSETDVTTGGVISTDLPLWKDAVAAGDTVRINYGNQISDVDIAADNTTGVVFSDSLIVGYNGESGFSTFGNLYIMDNANTDSVFKISTGRQVSVGTLIQVLDSWNLEITGSVNSSGVTVADVIAGGISVENNAGLQFSGLNAVTVNGGVTVADGALLQINNVGAVAMGGLNANGTVNITTVKLGQNGGATSGDLTMDGAKFASGATVNVAGDITVSGTLQNDSEDAEVSIVTGGGIVVGNLENSGRLMTISNAALTVNGTMKNDNVDGKLVLENLQSWQVLGTGENGYSFINSGDFIGAVSGLTKLAHGWNITGMDASNIFSLTTGQIDLGGNNAILNVLNDFELNVTNGNFVATTISNETNNAHLGISVSGALTAGYVLDNAVVSGTENSMQLDASQIVLNGQKIDDVNTAINVLSGASTMLSASDSLTVNALVSNQGKLTLNSASVVLGTVSNSGSSANLKIGSLLNDSGSVVIAGNITNDDGNVLVNSKSIQIAGDVINKSGIFEVLGSDANGSAMSIGGINLSGGVVNINASAGSLAIQNDIEVDGGTLNFANSVKNVTVGGDLTVDGDVVLGGTDNIANNMNLASSSVVLNATGDITMNNLDASKSGYSAQFISNDIQIKEDVNVASGSVIIFGNTNVNATSGLEIDGLMTVEASGGVKIYSKTTGVNALNNSGLITAYGNAIVATGGNLDITGSVRFDANATMGAGLSLMNNSLFTLQTTGQGANIALGSVDVAGGKSLYLDSEKGGVNIVSGATNSGTLQIDASGLIDVDGNITNLGTLNLTAGAVQVANIENGTNGTVKLVSTGDVDIVGISNSGTFNVAYDNFGSAVDMLNVTNTIQNSEGVMNLYAEQISASDVSVLGGKLNLYDVTNIAVGNSIYVDGDIYHGDTGGNLNLVDVAKVDAKTLTVNGNLIADSTDVAYEITDYVSVIGDISVLSDAVVNFDVTNGFAVNDLFNSGDVTIVAEGGIEATGAIENNAGILDLDSKSSDITAGAVTVNGGGVVLSGNGITTSGMFKANGILGQGTSSASVVINENDYVMNLGNLYVDGISQNGKLIINSSDIDVMGNIDASDLYFVASDANNFMNVYIDGDVSGNVDFVGLETMHITGNYLFNNNSLIDVAVLPYASGAGSVDINYWATISLQDDDSFGRIINPEGANVSALITVDGNFTSDLDVTGLGDLNAPVLQDSQIGLQLFDMVDTGDAIWLLYAEQGVYDLDIKIRNLNVKFCNEDASICVPYYNDLDKSNPDLPAYVSVRDTNSDGLADSLYVVFDNRFGGPVEVFGIQPIVERETNHTDGQYFAAGALDQMIAGQLENNKFFNRTPIEVIPVLFQDTNLSTVANELYLRMEDYVTNRDGTALTKFSGLFENYELEQVAGIMSLNEHTSFRSFEDRMFDEFIWNRNRNLKKSWLDVDYGMFFQENIDGHHADGDRFSIAGGFDWQESDTLILGLLARVSHSSSALNQDIDLSYGNVSQFGFIDTNVSDTNIGLGGYLMKTLGEKYRIYGNMFMDAHIFDVQREQTFVDTIEGHGNAFSVMSEVGLMHDILNQYIVGNVYARVGYNFGLDIKEQAAGSDYMRMKSDGYLLLTPGYSLMAQKRIYPSVWFQIRPYASVGIEYDVLGMSDSAEYKFVTANKYSQYGIEIDPLWANIGGGVEMLSARGIQFGLDYRYQYNTNMQLHNIKVSGSYRF